MTQIVDPKAFRVQEDTDVFLMSRVTGSDGAALQQADVSTITYSTFDLNDPSTAVADGVSLTVANVIYDTLQTSDDRWEADATGYNFAWSAPASLFPTGNRMVRVQVKITETGGAVIYLRWTATVYDVLGT